MRVPEPDEFDRVERDLAALDILPKVGMYGAFARLDYKPWFAIAEFIGNALQSYIDNSSRLAAADGKKPGSSRR